ncbi:hypothetical protein [Candidatus Galacturonibacter soehngenii]|uniref:DUF3168 domain-containing protein n=1 Tax=Candidatus Galacturonatibacter soehngenii TaxID=2307010 RepID=A0A7V7QJ18_9FIRM|nr:hypothetical protein [Candidatus Galacturonibacter soehngenii]KAB1437562.1 hypothetical protein F7O84_08115 [Candidatus Galacturonibacter soehngenii]
MINIKSQIYDAIKNISENVSDGYPKDFAIFPAIQYVEEYNSTHEFTDGAEQKAEIRFRIDIWNNKSTSDIAIRIDDAITALGLKRIYCQDINEATGYKHKQMRFAGIIDVNTGHVYHS